MNTKSFTTEAIPKLFFHYLIPSIFGTMVTSIYVLADTIIIGKGLGIKAMAALNIALPAYNIFFGTGLLFGVGGSVLMSIARGRGDYEGGNRYFTISVLLNAAACIFYTVFFFLFMEEIAVFLGGTKATLPYIMRYMPYVAGGMTAFAFSSMLQTFVRNDGAPKLSMIGVISGGVLNIILDCLFVFGFHWGMAGAAGATVCGSTLTVCILLTHLRSKSNNLHLNFKGIRLRHIFDIYRNGFTSFLVEITAGLVMFTFNQQILKYVGDIGVSVYGIITNTAIVVNCLCNGINQAAQPIVSTNYGAALKDRIREVKNLGIRTAVIICSVPALLGILKPNMYTYIFLKPNAEILSMAPHAIRIYFIGFIIMGVNMFTMSYFQSTLKAGYSLMLCLLRGCILSIAFAYILPLFFGINGVWMAMPLAELITLVIGRIMMHRAQKEIIKNV